jgi:hypothetical protein
MALCQRCQIQVHESLNHCPVCGSFIHEVKKGQEETLYPTPDYQRVEKQTANQLHAFFAFPLLLALLLTMMIDVTLIANEMGTTFLMTFIVFYAWILIYKTIYNRQGIGDIILWQLFGISIGTIILAFVHTTRFDAWPLQFVVPILISLSNLIFFILATVHRKTDVLLFQMFLLSLFGLLQFTLIFWLLDSEILVPSLIAGLTSLISLSALLTYLRKKFFEYLQRWLHI